MREVVAFLLFVSCSREGTYVPVPVVPEDPLVPTLNVQDFGAKGDDLIDDSAAFDAAIRALPATGGIVFAPRGLYLLRAIHSNPLRVLDVSNKRDITIAGEGKDATTLRMEPASYSSSILMFLVRGSSGITIKDVALDANRTHVLYEDEQSHCVQIESSTSVRIERVRFQNSGGDGVRLLGSLASWTDGITIEDSSFEDSFRNGISIQRTVRNVVIRNNSFDRISDQAISAEPTGNGGPTDILVEGNTVRHGGTKNMAVALAGIRPQDPIKRLTFRNNRLENAAANFVWVDGLVIEDNVIFGDTYHSPLRLQDVSDADIVSNEVNGEAQEGTGTGALQILNDDADFSSGIVLQDNRITVAQGISGIYVLDAWKDVAIIGNEIHGAGGRAGIRVDNIFVNGTMRDGFSIIDNRVENFTSGIVIVSRGDPYRNVEISSNSIDYDLADAFPTIGILFVGTGPYEIFAQLLANVMGVGVSTPVRLMEN